MAVLGLAASGVLVHDPTVDGHLRIIGERTNWCARNILQHWEDDAEFAILSAKPSRLFVSHDALEQHTFAEGLPPAAWLMRALVAEMNERTPEDKRAPIIVVLDHAEQLFAPATRERGVDGSAQELERQSALFLRDGLREILRGGPAVGMTVLATFPRDDHDVWPDTSTIRIGEQGQNYLRRGQTQGIPFTFAP